MDHSKQAVKARTYSVRETAALLGIGKTTLYEHTKNGTVPHLNPIRVGTTTRFPKDTIDALLGGAA